MLAERADDVTGPRRVRPARLIDSGRGRSIVVAARRQMVANGRCSCRGGQFRGGGGGSWADGRLLIDRALGLPTSRADPIRSESPRGDMPQSCHCYTVLYTTVKPLSTGRHCFKDYIATVISQVRQSRLVKKPIFSEWDEKRFFNFTSFSSWLCLIFTGYLISKKKKSFDPEQQSPLWFSFINFLLTIESDDGKTCYCIVLVIVFMWTKA